MLRLMIDTSVWLDIARRRDGQRIIVPLRVLKHQRKLDIVVPALILDEFDRNRPRAEAATTQSVRERFRLLKLDLQEYGDDEARRWIAEMAHQIPYLSARSLQNFQEISELLRSGTILEPTASEKAAVVQRALTKKAPFHLNKNSVADALLVEQYASLIRRGLPGSCLFATANSEDFSLPKGDKRVPHPDYSDVFDGDRSRYIYGADGLETALASLLGSDYVDEAAEVEVLEENPRTLEAIMAAEEEYFDKVWYGRSLRFEAEDSEYPVAVRDGARAHRARLEERWGKESLRCDDDWEWGFANGKLSALRWVLGSEWDFLDT